MKKLSIKICSVILVAALVFSTAFFTEFDLDGISKVFGASVCDHFNPTYYKAYGDFAYCDTIYRSYDPVTDDELYSMEGVKIVDYHGTDTHVVFPEYIDGKPVLAIEYVFGFTSCTNRKNLEKVEEVTLPSTLKVIGQDLFRGNKTLKSIVIPEGVERIGSYAFYNCTALEEIILPDSINSIFSQAFYKCTSLKSIVLPKNLYEVNYATFSNCSSLTNVTFNEGLWKIGNNAFERCNLETVELKEGFKNIGRYAFAYNQNLKSVDFPESLSEINECAFYNTAVTEFSLPDGVCSLNAALSGTMVTEFTLPKGIKTLEPVAIGQKIDTLILQGCDVAAGALAYTASKTLIYQGLGEIDEKAFYIDPDATEPTYDVPETVIFTDGINVNMDRFLCDTMGYYYRLDEETGYRIYSKEYTGAERYRPTGNDYVNNEVWHFDLTVENGVIITDYTGTETETLVVPDELVVAHISYPVIAIGRKAFKDCLAKDIVLPDSIEKIDAYAFYNCENLEKTNIPDGFTRIEPFTYGLCSNMTEINIPDSVVYIEDFAFDGRRLVKELVIPSSVKCIGERAFYNNYFIEALTLNEGLEEIGAHAFYANADSKSFFKDPYDPVPFTLVIPSTVKKIGKGAFEGSGVSGEVTIPASITEIPDSMFKDCYLLTSVNMHENITQIGDFAFFYAEGMTSVKLPSNLESIGEGAFENSMLESVILPSTLKHIGKYAFCYTQLKSVNIPSSVEEINEGVFFDCEKLTTINIANGVKYIDKYAFSYTLDRFILPPSITEIHEDAFYYVDSINHLVFNASCYEYDLDYDGLYGRPNYHLYLRFDKPFKNVTISKLTIGSSVKYIPSHCFDSAVIGEIVLPGNLIGIGDSAFSKANGSGMKTINLPESVKIIGDYAFKNSTIKEITLSQNIETVGNDAFVNASLEKLNYNCTNCTFNDNDKTDIEGIFKSPFSSCENLKTIVIGDDVQTVPDFMFCSISNLETVHIPDKITSVGKGAFAFSGVKSVTGLAGLTEIEDYAFYNCSSLAKFDLSALKITDIGNYAFANSGLVSFNGGTLLESVGDSCFAGCASLTDLALGTKIMLVGNNAFEGCSALKTVIIPDTVKNIGDRAFYNCSEVETVYMSVNVVYIPTECFANDSKLSSFTWNAESKLIGRLAFANCTSLSDLNFIGIEKLYESSFYNSGVKVVTLGEALNEADAALEEIQASSFQNCTGLETVSIGGNVSTVSNLAFAGCSNLEAALISDTVTEIAEDAFDGCDNLTIYCSEDSYAHAYASARGIPVSTFVIAAIPNKVYTGYAIKPEITVTLSGSSLKKNSDYTVSYSNNINVGTATVKVQGKGMYDMLSSKANFTIVTKNISKVSVADIRPQKHTGKAIEPSLTVTDNGRYLKEGKDYSVNYYNNTNQGVANAVISGIGNYSGTVTTSFEITELGSSEGFSDWFVRFITDSFTRIISFLLTYFIK